MAVAEHVASGTTSRCSILSLRRTDNVFSLFGRRFFVVLRLFLPGGQTEEELQFARLAEGGAVGVDAAQPIAEPESGRAVRARVAVVLDRSHAPDAAAAAAGQGRRVQFAHPH